MEDKILINVEVAGNGSATLNELKERSKELKKELGNLTIGTEEYNKVAQELNKTQNTYKDTMAAVSGRNSDLEKGLKATNAMVGITSNAFGAFTQILGKNEKDLGKFGQTLVKVQTAFNLAKSIQGMVSGINSAVKAFQMLNVTMLASPIFIIAGVIAGVVAAIMWMKDSEAELAETAKRTAEEHEKLVKSINDLNNARYIAGINSAATQYAILESSIRAAQRAYNDYEVDITDPESVAKQTNLLNDIIKLQNQRKDVVTQLGKAESKSAADRLKDLEIEYSGTKKIYDDLEVLGRNRTATESTAFYNTKNTLAELERSIETQKELVRLEEDKERAIKNSEEYTKKELEAAKQLVSARDALRKAEYDRLKTTDDIIARQVELNKQEDELRLILDNNKLSAQDRLKYTKELTAVTTELNAIETQQRKDNDAANKEAIAIEAENEKRKLEYEKLLNEVLSARSGAFRTPDERADDARAEMDLQMSIANNEVLSYEIRTEALNKYMAAQKEFSEANAEIAENHQKAIYGTMDAVSNMLSAGMNAMDQYSTEYKAFAIMQTVIETAKGAMQAFNSFSSIPVVGTILGAAAAAGVIAMGAVQVSTIANASKSSGVGSTLKTPSYTGTKQSEASNVPDLVLQSGTLSQTMANLPNEQLQEISGNRRVYILERDLQDAGNRAAIIEDESEI